MAATSCRRSSPARRIVARPQAASTPSTAVCTTISSSPTRSRLFVNDSPTRRIASARRARSRMQLLEPLLELLGHRVELLAERGELVVALGRDLLGEVAVPDRPRGDEQALHLGLQRARDRDREGDREDEEAEQGAEHQQRRAAVVGAVGHRGQQRQLAAVERVDVGRADAELRAVDVGRAVRGRSARASSGRDAPRTLPSLRTTTPTSAVCSSCLAKLLTLSTEVTSRPSGRSFWSRERVAGGGDADLGAVLELALAVELEQHAARVDRAGGVVEPRLDRVRVLLRDRPAEAGRRPRSPGRRRSPPPCCRGRGSGRPAAPRPAARRPGSAPSARRAGTARARPRPSG